MVTAIFQLSIFYRESFRCGVFFAGEYKAKPFQKLFILPKRFAINASFYNEDQEGNVLEASKLPLRYSPNAACPIANPYGTAEAPSVHNDTCFWLVGFLISLPNSNIGPIWCWCFNYEFTIYLVWKNCQQIEIGTFQLR